MDKYSVAFIIITTSIALGCSSNDRFKGTAKVRVPVSNNQEADVIPAAVLPDPVVIPVSEEIPVVKSEPVTTVLPGICKITLDYDPSEILCSLVEDSSNTVWKNSPEWDTSWLKNKKASWISPLASEKSGNMDFCPFVPGSDMAIYVSNFKIETDQVVDLEGMIDDIGQVRLWKDADSKQEVFSSLRGPKISTQIALKKGFYTVVVDGVDTGLFASGTIISFFDKDGSIIRQTQSTKDWCIYRVKSNTNIEEFLNSAAACKSCMVGESEQGKVTN